ncbi:MAG: hypothetical protein AB8B58_09555 [Roseobacter sp.]
MAFERKTAPAQNNTLEQFETMDRKHKKLPAKLGTEQLDTSSSIVLFGRIVEDLAVVKTHQGKRSEDADKSQPARIYGMTYDGDYVEMKTPVLFTVDPDNAYSLDDVPVPGPNPRNKAFYAKLSAWIVERTDTTIRLDVDQGKFEDLLTELGGEDLTGVSGARVSGARVSGARVSGARVSGARVSGARISGARD